MPHRPRDGDGWVQCELGHDHWGLHGAAGILVVAQGLVLMQHRAAWSHHGDTWGIPGGARGSTETAVQAALREAAEEAGLPAEAIEVAREVIDEHGGWSYTTVIATASSAVPVRPLDGESVAVEWIALEDVAAMRLHPGFASGWPAHLTALRSG